MAKGLPAFRYWGLILAGVLVLSLVVASTGLFHSRPTDQGPPGINHEGYRRIKLGMTLKEVEGILGEPPFNPDRPPSGKARMASTWNDESEGEFKDRDRSRIMLWDSKEAEIAVYIDKGGKVVYKEYRP